MLYEINGTDWQQAFSKETQQQAIEALEQGKILFFPKLVFSLTDLEQGFLTPKACDRSAKNVSYTCATDSLTHTSFKGENRAALKNMMSRYAKFTRHLVEHLLPIYISHLQVGRTSYRPVEALNRRTSYRKDDRRLHVDAFPSTPMGNNRILRVFCNINPAHQDRVWRVGEPFEKVVQRFKNQLTPYSSFKANLLKLFQITKSYRTAYDHYMLQLHDAMKADPEYQKYADQKEIHFPVGSAWIVFTDCTSHAAMSGQYVLEQTYYLPYTAMQNSNLAPQTILHFLYDNT